MSTRYKVKVEKWDLGASGDPEYRGVLSLTHLYFFFSFGEDIILMTLPRNTTFRVIEENCYTAMFQAINASKGEQGIEAGLALKIWNAPLSPKDCCYVILGEEVCVEIAGTEPKISVMKNISFAVAMHQVLTKECGSFKGPTVESWFDSKGFAQSGIESEDPQLLLKPWSLGLPVKTFAYAGVMEFFDSIYFFFTDSRSSFAIQIRSYGSFNVTVKAREFSIGQAVARMLSGQNVPVGQSWVVWNSKFTQLLDSDGLLYLNVPEEDRYENLILTATHDVEFLAKKTNIDFQPTISVESLMLKKFEETRLREAAFLAGEETP